MLRFRALLGAATVGACAVAGLPAVASAAPTAPFTALTVDLGEHRAYPVSTSAAYEYSTATMTAAAEPGDVVQIKAVTRDLRYTTTLTAAPPTGRGWVEGQTYPTSRVAGEDQARLDLVGNGRSCTTATGSITVTDLARDTESQLVTSFAASYEFRCTTASSPITGEVRYNSSLDYVAAVTTPSAIRFDDVPLGDKWSGVVYVKAGGSVASTFGQLGITGTHTAEFEVHEDLCSNRTIAVGAECRIRLRPKWTRPGTKSVLLQMSDNSSDGRLAVPVRVDVVDGTKGTYYPIAPARLMDTREGLGVPKARLGPGQTVDLQVAGRGGVPYTAGAVVLNVTVTGPTADSFLTVYPGTDTARPNASSINFAKGWLGSNNVTVMIDPVRGGTVKIYNRAGYTDAVVDVVGFYSGRNDPPAGLGRGGQYQWFEPYRILDTRVGGRGPLPGGAAVNGWIDFRLPEGEFNSHVRALVLNITAVTPEKAGFLTAWSGEGSKPLASTVNYGAGKVVPNLAYVQTVPCPSGGCGGATGAPSYRIHTSATTHLVVDLVGVMDDGTVADGLRFRPGSPTRILDTRVREGLWTSLNTGETGTVAVPPWGQLEEDTQVVALNMAAVAPERNTVLTVWPAGLGIAKPTASNLNPEAGQIVSNGVLTAIGPENAFHVHNHVGQTHLVGDVVGTFYLYPGTAGTTALAGPSRPQVAAAGSSDYGRD
ncbi:hypothetical protein ACPFP2_05250 [Micromonospora citrea]|uniref:hypothetical protein n=1 Tax=Micromonospora citrea TaxID=47855 RepID=UPI003C5C15C5